MTNEQNYPGVHIDNIVGVAGGEPETRFFDSGSGQTTLSIAVGEGYKNKQTGEWVDQGTTWYRVVATTDYAEQNWPTVGKGDKVRIDGGRLTAREFARRDGTKGQSFEVRFGNVTVVLRSGGDVPTVSADAPF